MAQSPAWASVFCTDTAGRELWGRRGQKLLANVFNSSFTIRQHHMEQSGAYREKRDGWHFSLELLVEDEESEFSAGSLSLARKVAFMIADGGEDFFLIKCVGFGIFCCCS